MVSPHALRVLVLVASCGSLVVGSSTVAVAQAAVVNACVVKGSSILRIVESPGDCRPGETPLSWNAAGPKGDPGDAKILTDRIVTLVLGTPVTKAISIPGLGRLDLSCDQFLQALVTLTWSENVQGWGPQGESFNITADTRPLRSPAIPNGPASGTWWFNTASGFWKVAYLQDSAVSVGLPPNDRVVIPCAAAVTVQTF